MLKIYQERTIPCTAPLSKIEIDFISSQTGMTYRGAFKNVKVGSRSSSAVYWQSDHPVVKFTTLDVACSVPEILLSFSVKGATLRDICMGPVCTYAAFDTNSDSGRCPIGAFSAL